MEQKLNDRYLFPSGVTSYGPMKSMAMVCQDCCGVWARSGTAAFTGPLLVVAHMRQLRTSRWAVGHA
jgi:hypothetical protein